MTAQVLAGLLPLVLPVALNLFLTCWTAASTIPTSCASRSPVAARDGWAAAPLRRLPPPRPGSRR
jgi:hypothetical protein